MEQENSNQTTQTLSFNDMLNNKEYQAEFDRRVQKAIATAKSNWDKEQETKKDSVDNAQISELLKQVNELKETIEKKDAKALQEKKDNEMLSKINKALEGKDFVNEYTKNAIVNEIKSKMKQDEQINIDNVLDELTKDKEGIFVNPNQAPNIPDMNEDIYKDLDKSAFEKMGYRERVQLKNDNPELFEELNNL